MPTSDELQACLMQTVRPIKVRGVVAHSHTESTMMRFPGLTLEPQQATEFATNFNMASTALESKLAMPVVPTALCLTLTADVRSPAQFRSAFGQEAYDAHFLVFKNKQPVREVGAVMDVPKRCCRLCFQCYSAYGML